MNAYTRFDFRKIISILWILALGCFSKALWAAEPLQVFVSVVPQKHFAEKIGGNQVKIESMVQPGFSPETYEPTAQQISALAKANLYVRVGMPFEEAWMKRIQGVNSDILIIDAREGVKLRHLEAHTHHEQSATKTPQALQAVDPHLWVSPRIAKQMSKQLADTFSKLRPEQTEFFNKNYASFATELDQLDQELVELFKDKQNLKFMVFHPAWGYLADTYGLEQIPIEVEGKEPGAKALAELITEAQHEQVKIIFVQPQFSQRAAEQVAKAIQGKVVSIDNLSEDYIPNLRKAAHLIAGVASE